jgi:hypothetical protein
VERGCLLGIVRKDLRGYETYGKLTERFNDGKYTKYDINGAKFGDGLFFL